MYLSANYSQNPAFSHTSQFLGMSGSFGVPQRGLTYGGGGGMTHPIPGLMGTNTGPDPNVDVKLEDKELWESFEEVGTEMIITKTGRRMFPGIKISLDGLVPTQKYCVILDIASVDEKRYKFSDGEWKVGGRAEPHHNRRFFVHPDSPNTGAHWTANQVSFRAAKLTNNLVNDPNMIVLNSMHKYQPRILIIPCDQLEKLPYAPMYSSYVFPSTTFVAVTAYQNNRVTKLKIAHNPFAKGFRERQTMNRKRRPEPEMEQVAGPSPERPMKEKKRIICSSPPVTQIVQLPDLYSYQESYHHSTPDVHALQKTEPSPSPPAESSCSNSSFSSGDGYSSHQYSTQYYNNQTQSNELWPPYGAHQPLTPSSQFQAHTFGALLGTDEPQTTWGSPNHDQGLSFESNSLIQPQSVDSGLCFLFN